MQLDLAPEAAGGQLQAGQRIDGDGIRRERANVADHDRDVAAAQQVAQAFAEPRHLAFSNRVGDDQDTDARFGLRWRRHAGSTARTPIARYAPLAACRAAANARRASRATVLR